MQERASSRPTSSSTRDVVASRARHGATRRAGWRLGLRLGGLQGTEGRSPAYRSDENATSGGEVVTTVLNRNTCSVRKDKTLPGEGELADTCVRDGHKQ